MKIFSILIGNVKNAFSRFPISFVCSFAASLMLIIDEFSPVISTILDRFALTFGWGIVFGCFVQLLLEYIFRAAEKENRPVKKVYALGQFVSVLVLVPIFFVSELDTYTQLRIFWTLLICFALLSLFLLTKVKQKETVIPLVIISIVISLIVSICVGIALSVIVSAIDNLLIEIKKVGSFHFSIWIFSFVCVFSCFFISFVTKKEPFEVPKVFKVLVLNILFPLYIALIVVLYIYLIKCLVLFALPSGTINWYVSFATIFYLLFYYSLGSFKNKATDLFYKIGAFFLFPLIVVQCIAFSIRISAYGFTPLRYASLLYIIFSIWFCIFSLYKKGMFMYFGIPFFAMTVFIGGISPLNLIDVPFAEQKARLERVLVKNNMLSGDKIEPLGNSDDISEQDKKIIVSTTNEIVGLNIKKIPYLKELQEEHIIREDVFVKTFGFPYSGSTDAYIKSIKLECNTRSFDISGYSTITMSTGFNVEKKAQGEARFCVYFDEIKIDVTETFMPRLKENANPDYSEILESPILIKTSYGDVFIYELLMYYNVIEDFYNIVFINGYLLE